MIPSKLQKQTGQFDCQSSRGMEAAPPLPPPKDMVLSIIIIICIGLISHQEKNIPLSMVEAEYDVSAVL